MADTKISALSAATAALAADEFAINEAGTSKKLTMQQIEDYLLISGSYSPGSFSVVTGNYLQMIKRLQLTGSQRGTLAGTARLRID